MKKYILSITCALAGLQGTAQQALTNVTLSGMPRCAFNDALKKVNVAYPQLIHAYRQSAAAMHNPMAKSTGVTYDIPVVFHIVYAAGQQAFNLPDSIIINQVDVLNKAYRKQHADTANTRAVFKPLSRDAEIQFHLATVDPSGNPTTGITRTVSSRAYFGAAAGSLDSLERIKKTSEGGIDPWPTDKYLNIWVANLSDAQGQISILGYGLPPLNPVPGNWPTGTDGALAGIIDGVVIQPHAVGSNNPLSAALQGLYTKGRAVVHEVGHYLGLQHVFGGNDGGPTSACGVIADDGIADTPEQSTLSFTSGCPAPTKNSCGAGDANDLPDMWENYMDYTTDACQTMFTNGQIDIMRGVLSVQRVTLTSPTSVHNVQSMPATALYPNPATDRIHVSYPGIIDKVTVMNFMGQRVSEWTGKEANSKTYDVHTLPSGNYLILFDCQGTLMRGKCTISR